jgi:2-isopropylmalate synthase
MKIQIYDTTLRDGTQGENVSFSVDDKLMIARKLDDLGVDYIEGGWPGSNPKDKEFFERAQTLRLDRAKIAAFGSTRYPKNRVEDDSNVRALLAARTTTITIFGKSWELHTRRALGITPEENLELITDTVACLKLHGREVIYDAEHFFDGFVTNPEFALATLRAAKNAGADRIVLCDTNGGTLTSTMVEILEEVKRHVDGPFGIHTHNDSDLAVANAVAAVEHGVTQVQGTINGYGERTGNANLCSVVPILELKMNYETIGRERLASLSGVAHYVSELANLPLRNDMPFVGRSAFAHKGGIHVSAVLKDTATYEHLAPETVGNRRRVLISELSGRSNVLYKLTENGLTERLEESAQRKLLSRIKEMEHLGYELESADGSFELLVRETLGSLKSFFKLESFRVATEKAGDQACRSEACVTVAVDGDVHSATAEGVGPVHALDLALRQCLSKFYPRIAEVRLTDYKVRVLESRGGTAARVRVLVEWSDRWRSWRTVGVSDNILEASWFALVDALRLELTRSASDQTALSENALST